MSNRDFLKKFDEILQEIFGEVKGNPSTPFQSFSDNLNYDNLNSDFSKFRNSVRKTKDGIVTTIYYVIGDDNKWTSANDNNLKNLQKELDECIKNEDFEKAVVLRDKIKNFKNNSTKIENLKKEMDIAIKEQNFEKAIEIRDELKKIN
jgi:protein-arginine kinase activator protein McsA